MGTRFLMNYKPSTPSSDANWRFIGMEQQEPQLVDFAVFDLDHDGKPEVFVKLEKMVIKKFIRKENRQEKIETLKGKVIVNFWVTYKTANPQLIFYKISEQEEGSWGTGDDLLGVMDINGDGIEEVVIRSSGWKTVEFEIYEYRQNNLKRVFHGAQYGC
jgi:hypothetical protein